MDSHKGNELANLPDDILYRIIDQLGLEDRRCLARVSKGFHQLVNESYNHTKKVTFEEQHFDMLYKWAKMTNTGLHIEDSHYCIFCMISDIFKSLKCVQFSKYFPLNTNMLTTIVQNSLMLKELELNQCRLLDGNVIDRVLLVAGNRIQRLYLKRLFKYRSIGLEPGIALSSLILDLTSITGYELESIYLRFPNLEVLYIGGIEGAPQSLYLSIRNCLKLRTLIIGSIDGPIRDETIIEERSDNRISYSLKTFKCDSRFPLENATIMVRSFFSNAEKLKICLNSDPNDEASKVFPLIIRICKNLRELELSMPTNQMIHGWDEFEPYHSNCLVASNDSIKRIKLEFLTCNHLHIDDILLTCSMCNNLESLDLELYQTNIKIDKIIAVKTRACPKLTELRLDFRVGKLVMGEDEYFAYQPTSVLRLLKLRGKFLLDFGGFVNLCSIAPCLEILDANIYCGNVKHKKRLLNMILYRMPRIRELRIGMRFCNADGRSFLQDYKNNIELDPVYNLPPRYNYTLKILETDGLSISMKQLEHLKALSFLEYEKCENKHLKQDDRYMILNKFPNKLTYERHKLAFENDEIIITRGRKTIDQMAWRDAKSELEIRPM